MKWYRILSLKYSPNTAGNCVWWGSDETGYTSDLSKACIIPEDVVAGWVSRYNNGTTTRAIESDEALAKSHTAVSWPIS